MSLKIAIVYIAVTQGPRTYDYCARFVGTYLAFPPLVEHRLIVACNGGPLALETAMLFLPIEKCEFYPRVNDQGFDISAYQEIARKTDAEFMLCFGETVFFHREGWLMRLAGERQKHGPGIYGCFASYLVRPHLNTTAFAADANYFRAYPHVLDKKGRYEFEHGQNSFWKRVRSMNGATKLVTWDGIYEPVQWRTPKNILWRGDQSNCLVHCNHTDRYEALEPEAKRHWESGANTLRDRTALLPGPRIPPPRVHA